MDTIFQPHKFVLKNGEQVLVRALQPDDKKLLSSGFVHLSTETIRKRFMGLRKTFSENELRFLTEMDGINHFALGATTLDGTLGIGVARYFRDENSPHQAELAIVVIDSCQGLGLGSYLMKLISNYAALQGIQELTGVIEQNNQSMLRLIKKFNFKTQPDSANHLMLMADLTKLDRDGD